VLAGEKDGTYQVWAVNLSNGERELELEMHVCGESEGLDVIPTLGGELHWLIAPFDPGCQLTFGPSSALLHFIPSPAHARFDVAVLDTSVSGIPGTVRVTVQATRRGHPLRQAQVSFAGGQARTDKQGLVTLSTTLERPGRFKALAQKGQSYGLSGLVPVGLASTTPSALVSRSGAG